MPPALIPHKTFPGNRPSSSLLLRRLDAFAAGQLLALYEHRTVVEGFLWGVPSFDQWGVELGKVLAKQVRAQLAASRGAAAALGGGTGAAADGGMAAATAAAGAGAVDGFNASTTALMLRYLRAVDSRY